MSLQHSGLKGSVTMKLSQLQNLCKRDPAGYADDYQSQLSRFAAELHILESSPGRESSKLVDLMQFVAAVTSSAYKADAAQVAAKLTSLLSTHAAALHADTRRAAAQCLVLMRNRNAVAPDALMELFFGLMTVPDKALRSMV
jgi:protein SDA1